MNFFNFGTSSQAWFEFITSAIVVAFAIFYMVHIWKLTQLKPRAKKARKKIIRKLWVVSIIFGVYVWAVFFAFGPGRPVVYTSEPTGALELTDSYETETRTKDELQADAYDRKEESLKAQDEKINVDDYIKKHTGD